MRSKTKEPYERNNQKNDACHLLGKFNSSSKCPNIQQPYRIRSWPLYERGFDATLSVEHETKNHNAWEYFLNGYVKYDKDANAGHITNESFWKNYRTWGVGVAYKPCVFRGKNNYGALRLGGSLGSDTHEFVGWVNAGYEHNFVLHHGIKLFVQARTDLAINGLDLFRTGVSIGFKFPVGKR